MNSQDVIREEYDIANKAQRVNVVAGGVGLATVNVNGSATVFAVVNTSAAGDPKTFIGLTTAVIGSSPTIFAVVNTSASASGNVTLDAGSKTQIVGNLTLSDSKGFIGLVSVSGFANPLPVSGTFYQATQPVSFGNVTVSDSKGFIGLVSVSGFANPLPVTFSGNVTLDSGSKTQIVGNVTLSDSKQYIGLVSVSHAAWADPKTYIGLTTTTIANSTLFAVVNTGAVGNTNALATLLAGPNYIGLVTNVNASAWPDPKGYIGLVTITGSLAAASGNVTLDAGSKTQIIGNLTLSDSKAYIGLVTATIVGSVNTGMTTIFPGPNYIGLVSANLGTGASWIGLVSVSGSVGFSGNVTLDAGSKTQIVGNLTLSDSKTYIGLTTTTIGNAPILGASTNYIGLVTVANTVPVTFSGNVTLDVGSKTQIIGNLTLSDSKGFIGLVSVSGFANPLPVTFSGNVTLDVGSLVAIRGNLTLSDSKGYIGLVTASTVNGAGTQFIGLVTAWTRNAGTTKTLIHQNIGMYAASIATIAVPSNTFKITQLLVNSDATVRLNIKSGATYLTGNASIGITLSPNGGWVENGSPDSPVYIGLAGAAAIVVEKFETGVTAKISGKLLYFDE